MDSHKEQSQLSPLLLLLFQDRQEPHQNIVTALECVLKSST